MKAEAGNHLLDAARALRSERDKERDLALQEEQEKEIISKLQVLDNNFLFINDKHVEIIILRSSSSKILKISKFDAKEL